MNRWKSTDQLPERTSSVPDALAFLWLFLGRSIHQKSLLFNVVDFGKNAFTHRTQNSSKKHSFWMANVAWRRSSFMETIKHFSDASCHFLLDIVVFLQLWLRMVPTQVVISNSWSSFYSSTLPSQEWRSISICASSCYRIAPTQTVISIYWMPLSLPSLESNSPSSAAHFLDDWEAFLVPNGDFSSFAPNNCSFNGERVQISFIRRQIFASGCRGRLRLGDVVRSVL